MEIVKSRRKWGSRDYPERDLIRGEWVELAHSWHLCSGFMESARDGTKQPVFHTEQPEFRMVSFGSVETDCGKRNKDEAKSGTILV